jgi:hypothetical protein
MYAAMHSESSIENNIESARKEHELGLTNYVSSSGAV